MQRPPTRHLGFDGTKSHWPRPVLTATTGPTRRPQTGSSTGDPAYKLPEGLSTPALFLVQWYRRPQTCQIIPPFLRGEKKKNTSQNLEPRLSPVETLTHSPMGLYIVYC